MSARPTERGSCADLHPAVQDKYFNGNARTDPFSYHTARQICWHCPVLAPCLTDAISSPYSVGLGNVGMRAGERGGALLEMRRRYVIDGVPAHELVTEALRHQFDMRATGDFPYLRDGRFPDVELAEPGKGGSL